MRGNFFFVFVLFSLAVICSGYFLAVDHLAIPQRAVDKSNKHFFLRASAPFEDRIFVEGGSNTIYGIDASELEQHFGRYTLVLGDNAYYPLSHKLYRLKEYLKPGDIVLLPLEWNHYSHGNVIPEVYVQSILDQEGSNAFYYHHLPLLQRIAFVYRHVPFLLALERVVYRNAFLHKNYDLRESTKLSSYLMGANIYLDQVRGDFTGIERNPGEYEKQRNFTCNEYLLRGIPERGYQISQQFIGNLVLAKRIEKDTGARIVFTWPSVTDYWGDNCYRSADGQRLAKYAAQIRSVVKSYGFEFIGEYEEKAYDNSCFWDTYYHLTRECALVNTQKLIADMEGIGVAAASNLDSERIFKVLLRFLFEARFPEIEKQQRLDQSIRGSEMPEFMNFLHGWSEMTSHGPWTIGEKSVLGIPVGNLPIAGLRLQGRYIEDVKPIGVWINGTYLGNHVLLDYTFDVRGMADEDGMLIVHLQHIDQASSTEPSQSNTGKLLRYGLIRFTLLSETGESVLQNQHVKPDFSQGD